MQNFLIIGFIAICSPISLFGQYEDYVFRFGQQWAYGSARVQGMSNAYSCLGVDFSTVSINPAGLARSTRSSFSISGGISSSKIGADYYNTSSEEDNVNLNFNEISLYKAIKIKKTKWRYGHFGAGYTRFRNLNETYRVKGNSNFSLAEDFAFKSQGVSGDELINKRPFGGDLAYQTYLIDPDTSQPGFFYQANLPNDTSIQKDVLQENTGHFGEVTLSFAGNYNNKLYVGATIGIPRVKFEEETTHAETVNGDPTNGIQSFIYTENVLTKGTGINLKLGAIYLPVSWLRIGASLHTPSRIVMKEQYTATLSSKVDGQAYEIGEEYRPTGNFEYVMKTPLKANLSFAAILAKRVVISVEGDYINYSGGELKSSNDQQFETNFSFENDLIQDIARKTSFNVRTGLEVRLVKTLAVRGGFSYYQSPYNNSNKGQQSDVLTFSGGLGYRMKHFFIDASYVRRMMEKQVYNVDPTVGDEPAYLDFVNSNITLTLGYRF